MIKTSLSRLPPLLLVFDWTGRDNQHIRFFSKPKSCHLTNLYLFPFPKKKIPLSCLGLLKRPVHGRGTEIMAGTLPTGPGSKQRVRRHETRRYRGRRKSEQISSKALPVALLSNDRRAQNKQTWKAENAQSTITRSLSTERTGETTRSGN